MCVIPTLLLRSYWPLLHWRSRQDGRDGADGERDGRVTAGGGVELPTSGAGRPGPTGAARPLVLPETFDGTGSWSEWCYHFENVAAVNGWDGAQKLQWL